MIIAQCCTSKCKWGLGRLWDGVVCSREVFGESSGKPRGNIYSQAERGEGWKRGEVNVQGGVSVLSKKEGLFYFGWKEGGECTGRVGTMSQDFDSLYRRE